jgi:hypothetical protein
MLFGKVSKLSITFVLSNFLILHQFHSEGFCEIIVGLNQNLS